MIGGDKINQNLFHLSGAGGVRTPEGGMAIKLEQREQICSVITAGELAELGGFECRRMRKSRCSRIIPRLLFGYLGIIYSSVQWLRAEFRSSGGMQTGIFNRYLGVILRHSLQRALWAAVKDWKYLHIYGGLSPQSTEHQGKKLCQFQGISLCL